MDERGGILLKCASRRWAPLLFIVMLWLAQPAVVQAAGASLRMSPSNGNFEVGALIDVSLILDTGGESVNALRADVQFPADKLQVINPAASTSFISIWAVPPTYSNTEGTIGLQGGLPSPGINTSAGVVSTVTFRVISAGNAAVKLLPTSSVLRNDGKGTNILAFMGSAAFNLRVPPPVGPVVSSPTHGDNASTAGAWSNNTNAEFVWEPIPGAVGYSFVFDQNAKQMPDDTPDTTKTSTSVQTNADGIWYFHIKAKTDTWGGVTHFPIKVDPTPPAEFTVKASQMTLTPDETTTLTFLTTDGASGIDHYEIKQVDKGKQKSGQTTLFVETTSPYLVSKMPVGEYEFIVRAIDRAGNTTAASVTLKVVASGLPFFARTPLFRNVTVTNIVIISLAALVLIALIFFLIRRFRLRATFRHDLAALEHDAQRKYASLQQEIQELERAKRVVEQDFESPKSAPPGSPPAQT